MTKPKKTRGVPYSRRRVAVVLSHNGEETLYPLKREAVAKRPAMATLKCVVRNSGINSRPTILRRYHGLSPESSNIELNRLLSVYDPPILPPGIRLECNKNNTFVLKLHKTKGKGTI